MFLFLIVLLQSIPAPAQEGFKHESKIAALVEPYLTHEKVNAVSVGVISNGQIWKMSFGTLDGDAIESGQLKLDGPIGTIMKELAEKNSTAGNSITFKQLSQHVSGLPLDRLQSVKSSRTLRTSHIKHHFTWNDL